MPLIDETVTVAPGTARTWAFTSKWDSSRLHFGFDMSGPTDFYVTVPEGLPSLSRGEDLPWFWKALGQTGVNTALWLPEAGPWVLVVHNKGRVPLSGSVHAWNTWTKPLPPTIWGSTRAAQVAERSAARSLSLQRIN